MRICASAHNWHLDLLHTSAWRQRDKWKIFFKIEWNEIINVNNHFLSEHSKHTYTKWCVYSEHIATLCALKQSSIRVLQLEHLRSYTYVLFVGGNKNIPSIIIFFVSIERNLCFYDYLHSVHTYSYRKCGSSIFCCCCRCCWYLFYSKLHSVVRISYGIVKVNCIVFIERLLLHNMTIDGTRNF